MLTGGGTGGHFYPLIAVAREIIKIAREKHIIDPELIFASDSFYDKKVLDEENIRFLKLPAGKMRRYFSFLNFIDFFKIIFGILVSIFKIYSEMPDVVFSKGGYASAPVVIAARIFRIPLIIHESDVVPGKAHNFVKSYAKRVAVSFDKTVKYFPKASVALIGNPVRSGLYRGNLEESREAFNLEFVKDDKGTNKIFPEVILILGGSQGAQKINEIILMVLPELVKNYQIIHQCGAKNLEETKNISEVVLKDLEHKNRYHVFGFLNEFDYRDAGFASDLIISRASAGTIFEIAEWGKPSILIPITNSAQNHQRENAWEYAKIGAAEVIEEANLAPHIFLSEIKNIMKNNEKKEKMSVSAKNFSKPEAARKIAEEIINMALDHAD